MIADKKLNKRVGQVLSSGNNGKMLVELLGQDVTLGVQVVFQNCVFYRSRLEAQSWNFWYFLCASYEFKQQFICERVLKEKNDLK